MIRIRASYFAFALAIASSTLSSVRAQDSDEPGASSESEGLDSGGHALGMNRGTWSIAPRLGFGVDTNGGGVDPFGWMIGGNLSYSFARARFFASAEGNLYFGDSVGGVRARFLQGSLWVGYDANLGRRFVLRPAIGGGLDGLLVRGAGERDFSVGLIGGAELRGMVFVTDRFFLDAGGRFTFDLTRHNGADRIAGVTGYVGLGLTF